MKRRLAVVVARTALVVRGLWPDHNPLRRRLDRIEAAVVGGLVVAFLVGAPVAALTAHSLTWHAASRAATAERSWRQLRAVLLATVPQSGEPAVRAAWTAPDGTRRRGVIMATPGTRVGRQEKVWVSASGRLTGRPPLQAWQVQGQAMLAAVLAPAALLVLLVCTGQLVHLELGHWRLAAWDADWRATGPQWTRQR
jgi:hypothetical protein